MTITHLSSLHASPTKKLPPRSRLQTDRWLARRWQRHAEPRVVDGVVHDTSVAAVWSDAARNKDLGANYGDASNHADIIVVEVMRISGGIGARHRHTRPDTRAITWCAHDNERLLRAYPPRVAP